LRIDNYISFSKILRRVAYPVEPFGFEYIKGELPPPLLQGNRDRMGKQPGLFEQANRRLANKLQYMHPDRCYNSRQTVPSFFESSIAKSQAATTSAS